MEQVLINVSRAPMSIMLPSGRPILINPGFGVQGDYFLKYLEPGKFEVLSRVPVGFTVRGVAQPLVTDQTRDNTGPSSKVGARLDNKSAAKASAKTVGAAMAEVGKEPSLENLSSGIPGVASPDADESQTFQGVSAQTWISRIKAISNATLAQQMKLGDLKELAKVLGVTADLQTKADLIEAIRVRTNV